MLFVLITGPYDEAPVTDDYHAPIFASAARIRKSRTNGACKLRANTIIAQKADGASGAIINQQLMTHVPAFV